jgi:NADH-quinone oxidoreductase subunit N
LYGLLINAALGMVLVAAASHWLIFFLGLQVLSIALYVIIPIRLNDPQGQEAGVKYFIMSAVASAFLTFGIALLYGVTGSLDFNASLALNLQGLDLTVPLLGLALILVGIGFKISMVPLHLWTPDVYEGAPAPVTAFLSSGSKVALFAGSRITCFGRCLEMAGRLWVWPYSTSPSATSPHSIRPSQAFAGYSSIAQMATCSWLWWPNRTLSACSFPAVCGHGWGRSDCWGPLRSGTWTTTDFEAGLSHPWNAAVFTACLLSLVGLPPTGGFLGKLLLFWAVIKGGFVWLAVIGIITTILSIFFYLKVLTTLYMHPQARPLNIPGTDLAMYLAGALIFALLLWSGIIPGPLLAKLSNIAGLLPSP